MRILLIDIDTLRPDHLGCYGYHRPTSPHIDALAEGGVRFDQVYASDVPCLPSHTALCTGRFCTRTGVVGHGGRAAELDLAPALLARTSALLDEWLAAQLPLARDGVDPLAVVMAEGGPYHVRGHLPAYLDRLRATGRSQWADHFATR